MPKFFVVQPDWTRLTRDQNWDLSACDTNDAKGARRAALVLEEALLEEASTTGRFTTFTVEASDLGEVFAKLNADERPEMEGLRPFARLRSMSVGDAVVALETGKCFQVARIGFQPLEGVLADDLRGAAGL